MAEIVRWKKHKRPFALPLDVPYKRPAAIEYAVPVVLNKDVGKSRSKWMKAGSGRRQEVDAGRKWMEANMRITGLHD
jgi:hypothetical protein